MDTSLTPFLKRVFSGETLPEQEAAQAFSIILGGHAPSIEIAGFLGAIAGRGETIDEIVGAVKTLREKATMIDAPPDVVDCCGTGGDHAGTFNISTAVAFVLAGCGVRVAKHGNRASSSQSGSADVLEALGLNLNASTIAVRKALWEHNLCFFMAPHYNPAMRHVIETRKALKTRTIFNLLGPLLNPAGAKHQLIGVYDQKWCLPIAQTLNRLGTEHAWVVHGQDGLDEITTTTATTVTELKNGQIETYDIHPKDIGLDLCSAQDLQGGDATQNAKALKDLLHGQPGPYRDIVIFNTAAALIVSGKAQTLQDGADHACQSIDSGAALNALNQLIETYSNG